MASQTIRDGVMSLKRWRHGFLDGVRTYVVPTGRVVVPTGRYIVLAGKGNVGLIFTKADLKEVLEEVAKYKVRVKMLKVCHQARVEQTQKEESSIPSSSMQRQGKYVVVTAAQKVLVSASKGSIQEWPTFVTGVGEGLLKGLKKKPAHKSSKAGQLIAAGNTADANDILTIKTWK
ncbi:hypothetical protein Tco_0832914 [Tanacetum coccineum]